MALDKSILIEQQTKTLADKVSIALNGVDLNYLGYDRTKENNIILSKTNAHSNRVLFWLSCKRDDFIRESFKGGVLYEFLGKLNNNTNLSDWEFQIRNKFNNEFANDLDLLTLSLKTDKTYRKLIIDMIVRDRIENIIFPVSTEASL